MDIPYALMRYTAMRDDLHGRPAAMQTDKDVQDYLWILKWSNVEEWTEFQKDLKYTYHNVPGFKPSIIEYGKKGQGKAAGRFVSVYTAAEFDLVLKKGAERIRGTV